MTLVKRKRKGEEREFRGVVFVGANRSGSISRSTGFHPYRLTKLLAIIGEKSSADASPSLSKRSRGIDR